MENDEEQVGSIRQSKYANGVLERNGNGEGNGNNKWQGIVVDGKTLILDWNDHMMKKVLRFARRDKLGQCSDFRET
ncbi:hypothetical protein COOONC_03204 [Cooperia oncophora]